MNSKSPTVRVASLNCRGLHKISHTMKCSNFIRYLRLLGYDILVFQETHANTHAIQELLDMQLQAKSSVWTKHCGIVSLNSNYTIHTHFLGVDGRFILADIFLQSDIPQRQPNIVPTPLFTILDIYAPAVYSKRKEFFNSLCLLPQLIAKLTSTESNLLVMGDFNFNMSRPTGISSEWTTMLHIYFRDCFEADKQPTFHRGTSSSTIDYIFCSNSFSQHIKRQRQTFLSTDWTDHSMLSVDICIPRDDLGKGSWKANPLLAQSLRYRDGLRTHLDNCIHQQSLLPPETRLSNQRLWDNLKDEIRSYTRSFQLDRKSWRMKQIKKLNKKRNRILRDYSNHGILSHLLPVVERQLSTLEEEAAEIESLKSGLQWRESGEKSPGLLKRLVNGRSSQRFISHLQNPLTGQLSESMDEKMNFITTFYQQLYTPEAVHPESIDHLLGLHTGRDSFRTLSTEQQNSLLDLFDLDDLTEACKRSPRRSSPGTDGLPYEILRIFITLPSAAGLILAVYNDALTKSIFPPSWYQSLMTLLPKKGDLSNITNYRPISLVNTDPKLFTRPLNSRIMVVADQIVNEFQMGFMPGKFIGENGLLAQMVLEDAQAHNSDGHSLGLLLDQEKAYDRVNLEYLRQVLLHYGFPEPFVDCIYTLFSHNKIKINVNGFLSENDICKKRGLKQGDPISCILYNISLEPFLRTVLDDPAIVGYNFTMRRGLAPLPPIKLLSYADDTLLFLNNTVDFVHILTHLEHYSFASNAKINYHKVHAISLSGINIEDHWMDLLASRGIHNIHSKEDPDPIIYLGFPLLHTTRQRSSFFAEFIHKLDSTALLHSTRNVSVLGRATIATSLILSKCWYILRVTPVTLSDLQKIQSVVSRFINKKIFPKISWDVITAPKTNGGLGVIAPTVQHKTLIFRWVDPILFTRDHASTIHRFIAAHIQNRVFSDNINITLLFPQSRLSSHFQGLTTVDMFFHSMDSVPRRFHLSDPNPLECLLLPIPAILSTSDTSGSFKLSKKLRPISVEMVFNYHPSAPFLARKDPIDITPNLRIVTKKLFTAIDRNSALLEPFFQKCLVPSSLNLFTHSSRTHIHNNHLNFRSFKAHLQLETPMDPEDASISTKSFRLAINQQHYTSTISPFYWKKFWRLALLYVQRNVIYRLVYQKIPHMQLLHRLQPSKFPTALCSICFQHTDSTSHFFFTCPRKLPFWKSLINEFLWPTTRTSDIFTAFSTLNFSRIRLQSHIVNASSDVVLYIALSELWKAHWNCVFNNKSFTSDLVLNSTRYSVTRWSQEEEVPRRL